MYVRVFNEIFTKLLRLDSCLLRFCCAIEEIFKIQHCFKIGGSLQNSKSVCLNVKGLEVLHKKF